MKKVEYICQYKSRSGARWLDSLTAGFTLEEVRLEKKWNISEERESRIIKRTTTEEVVE